MNKRIYVAIFLLGFSMLGVISFQGYWLRENYKHESKSFRRDVYKSFSSAMITELDKRMKVFVESMDMDAFHQNYDRNKFRRRRIHKMKGGSFSYLEYEESIKSYKGEEEIDKLSREDFDLKQKQFDRLILSLMSKIENPQNTPGASFNIDFFNEVFKEELREFGIYLDYKLAFFIHGELVEEKNGHLDAKDLSRATIFKLKNSGISGSTLAVIFPDKDWYLASKNKMITLASVFLIFLSIGSIVYIIRSFFSQKRISEIRRDFMNNMTHELKTPISTVGLALEAMQNFKILENPERTEQYVSIARKENHRLGMLVEKVLKMSAYEQESINMKMENIKADTSVEEVIKNLTFQIENKGGEVTKSMNADNVTVSVDKVHFTNVIYNLLDNALKYSGKKPEIKVSTFVKNNFWFVEITDNGIGIPTTYQNKIFEKFFRVPSGNIHDVKGYGLGLSYGFNIVNRFKGDISVRSEVNKGSTFTVKLPVSNG